MIFFKVIWVFLKIGTFGFGGGYAMLSLIQDEVVARNGWITKEEFVDLVAVSQMTPGPIGINTATYAGYSALENAGYSPYISILGSVIATVSLCLPSFIMITLIFHFFVRFKNNKYFSYVMMSIRPLSIALIGLAALSLMTTDNFTDYFSIFIFLGAFPLATRFKLHPIYIIGIASIIGLIIY